MTSEEVPGQARAEAVVDLWSKVCKAALTGEERSKLCQEAVVHALGGFSDKDLLLSLHRARGSSTAPPPDFEVWLNVLQPPVVVAEVEARGPSVRQRVETLLETRKQRWAGSHDFMLPFPRATVDEAFALLRMRLDEAEATHFLLRKRVPRWRTAPSRQLVGAPVVETSLVELAVVSILSATEKPWQFSSTPDGRMFTGPKHGYHREHERTYVVGLSDILDTASNVVATHRARAGGRVYVHEGLLECADCKLVVAWLGRVGGRSVAFGACLKVPAGRGGRR